jgi:branched-chain amino acid transport system ATP-binding protein
MKISEAIATRQPAFPSDGRVVLSIRDLRKSFGGLVVLDSVNADLHEGEIVLLRGDNGSGKTTLLNILTGNLEPDAGAIHLRANGDEENFHFPRKWWQGLNPFDHFTPERVAREGVGRTWQDVRLFRALTLLENIAVAKPAQHGENPLRALVSRARTTPEFATRQSSAALLADLNLAGRERSSGDKISLGQSKRVAIARAVHAGARILFLDEPLSGLDAAGIEEVLVLLSSLAKNERLTLVIVEHTFNIPRVLKLAHTVWTLRDGRLVVQSPAEVQKEYVTDSSDGLVALIARQLGNGYQRQDITLADGACLTKFFAANVTADRPFLLEVSDLVARRGPRVVVGRNTDGGKREGLGFRLCEGDIAIIQAPNGWGKTTLLDTLLGLNARSSGTIRHAVADPGATPWELACVGIRYIRASNQHFNSLSVADADRLLSRKSERAEFPDNRLIGELSGGMRQRLLWEHATSDGSEILLADEPFLGLDDVTISYCVSRLTRTRAALIAIPSSA